jgi:hypothetical protein
MKPSRDIDMYRRIGGLMSLAPASFRLIVFTGDQGAAAVAG